MNAEKVILADLTMVLGSSSLIIFKDSQRNVSDTFASPATFLISQLIDYFCILLASSITVTSVQNANNVIFLETSQVAKYIEQCVSPGMFVGTLYISEFISILNNGFSAQMYNITFDEKDYLGFEITLKVVITVIELWYTLYVLVKQFRARRSVTMEPQYTVSRHSHLTRGV